MTNFRKVLELYNNNCEGHKANESNIVYKDESEEDITIKGNIKENGELNCYEIIFFKSKDCAKQYASICIYEGQYDEDNIWESKSEDETIIDKYVDAPNYI